MKKIKNPWLRIIRAAEKGKGLRLSEEEVWRLSQDDAVQRAATQSEESEDDDELRRTDNSTSR